jgi:hypothetical protein
MTQLEMGQYIIDEFTTIKKKVVNVTPGEHPLEAKIFFADGTYQQVTGKLAADVLSAEQVREPDGAEAATKLV